MMKRLALLTGLGVGYVLGARAGREQYDKIVEQAQALWGNPKVQEQVAHAQETVKEQAPAAADRVKSAVGHGEDSSQESSSSQTPAATTPATASGPTTTGPTTTGPTTTGPTTTAPASTGPGGGI